MTRTSGPAKGSARWGKEVARAREQLHRGWLAALAHAGLFVFAAIFMGLSTVLPAETWLRVLGMAALLAVLGWLTKGGVRAAPFLLLLAALASFAVPLVLRQGLRLEMAGVVFAWFYLEALLAAVALHGRLRPPTGEARPAGRK